MRTHPRYVQLFVLSCASLLTLSAWSESIPLSAVNRAAEVIDRAIEAHGGAKTLRDIKTVSQRSRFKNFASFQSRRPGPPWDVSYTDNFYAVDFENETAFTSNKGEGSGFITDAATLISPDENVNIDRRAGTVTPIAQPDFNTTVGPFVRITPPLLVRTLMMRRHTSNWLGEAEVNDAPADIVSLVMEVGPALFLYIDRKSGLLVKAERVLAPFGQVEYHYLDYQTVNGLPVNRAFELFANGEPNLTIELEPLVINQPIANYLKVPKDLTRVARFTPDPLKSYKLADGVHLIGGTGTYAMFVENDDYVVAIGGTAGIPQRIEELRQIGVTKPIRFGVMTHHHNDHVVGVAPYVDEGATIVGHKSHAKVIRAAASGDIDLRRVGDKHDLGKGANRVELYDIGPTPHAEHILVAYLPEHKILFQADHSGFPQTGPPGPAQPVAVALHDAIERLGLDVEHLVSAHSSRVITREELDDAIRGSG